MGRRTYEKAKSVTESGDAELIEEMLEMIDTGNGLELMSPVKSGGVDTPGEK